MKTVNSLLLLGLCATSCSPADDDGIFCMFGFDQARPDILSPDTTSPDTTSPDRESRPIAVPQKVRTPPSSSPHARSAPMSIFSASYGSGHTDSWGGIGHGLYRTTSEKAFGYGRHRSFVAQQPETPLHTMLQGLSVTTEADAAAFKRATDQILTFFGIVERTRAVGNYGLALDKSLFLLQGVLKEIVDFLSLTEEVALQSPVPFHAFTSELLPGIRESVQSARALQRFYRFGDSFAIKECFSRLTYRLEESAINFIVPCISLLGSMLSDSEYCVHYEIYLPPLTDAVEDIDWNVVYIRLKELYGDFVMVDERVANHRNRLVHKIERLLENCDNSLDSCREYLEQIKASLQVEGLEME